MNVKTISRRELLSQTAALTALANAQLAWPAWLPRFAFTPNGAAPRGDTLVVVFLRGGADGLNIIVPHGEDFYYQQRPKIAVARPDDKSADAANRSLDLDGFFGLHPALAPLLPIFKGGQMVAVHAAGSPDPTRSHFEAMDYMESGTPGQHTLTSGWLGRHLDSLDTANNSPLRAVGWGTALQRSLRGKIPAVSIKSIIDYHLSGRADAATDMLRTLNQLYTDSPDLSDNSKETQAVLELVSRINIAAYTPAGGATYGKEDFDRALMQTAALIKADVGLEVAAIDLGGWDTHQNEVMDLQKELTKLATGIAAFHADLGDLNSKTTVVIMSEFGRRVQENGSGGTDHGHGNMMMVMGGHVASKPVISDWPTLAPEKLVNGDVNITTDYRDVLSEILMNRLKNPAVAQVFPNYTPKLKGVVRKD
jgi:uncharacterized protein (DUF1501 family)